MSRSSIHQTYRQSINQSINYKSLHIINIYILALRENIIQETGFTGNTQEVRLIDQSLRVYTSNIPCNQLRAVSSQRNSCQIRHFAPHKSYSYSTHSSHAHCSYIQGINIPRLSTRLSCVFHILFPAFLCGKHDTKRCDALRVVLNNF